MSDRPRRKVYRLRNSIDSPGPGRPFRLPRSLWGISGPTARRLVAQQEQAHAEQLRRAEEQLAAARSEQAALEKQIAHLQERLKVSRELVGVLRQANAREKAARAVLAARLIDRQAEEDAQQAAALNSLKLEQARAAAELAREHEALRSLVSALYRSLTAAGLMPPELAISAEFHEIPESVAMPPGRTPDLDMDVGDGLPQPTGRVHWHDFLIGKIAGETLYDAASQIIVRQGDTLTPELLSATEEAGRLFELILSCKLGPAEPMI